MAAITIPKIDWAAREREINVRGETIWKEVVSAVGEKRVRETLVNSSKPHFSSWNPFKVCQVIDKAFTWRIDFRHSLAKVQHGPIPMPKITLIEGDEIKGYASPRKWEIFIGKLNFLKKEDLPDGWAAYDIEQKMNYLTQLVGPVDWVDLMCFDKLLEIEVSGAIAHEFAHLAIACPEYYSHDADSRRKLDQPMERLADLYAAHANPEYAKSLMARLKVWKRADKINHLSSLMINPNNPIIPTEKFKKWKEAERLWSEQTEKAYDEIRSANSSSVKSNDESSHPLIFERIENLTKTLENLEASQKVSTPSKSD